MLQSIRTHFYSFSNNLRERIPGSFNVFSNAVVYAFNSFLFSITGVHFVKHLARKEAVSAFTCGFLFSRAARTSSWIASIVVCNKNINVLTQ